MIGASLTFSQQIVLTVILPVLIVSWVLMGVAMYESRQEKAAVRKGLTAAWSSHREEHRRDYQQILADLKRSHPGAASPMPQNMMRLSAKPMIVVLTTGG